MAVRAEEILQELVLEDPTICSRCFSNPMTTRERSGVVSGDVPCSEDECGAIDISMESDPQPYSVIRPRAINLWDLLQEHENEIDKTAYVQAIEAYIGEHPPKEVFVKSIAHGIGELDSTDFPIQFQRKKSEDESGNEDTGEENEEESIEEIIAQKPISTGYVDELEIPDEMLEELSLFEVIGDTTDDIYFLQAPHKFTEKHNLDYVDIYGPERVAEVAVYANWDTLRDFSPGTIRKWLNKVDDEYVDHIINSSIRRGIGPDEWLGDNERHPFRSNSFWQIVKDKKAQRILGSMRGNEKNAVTVEEIATDIEENRSIVQKLLIVLESGEYVERAYPSQEDTISSVSPPRKWRYVHS